MEQFVRLKCMKIGGKLRVRIVSPGYNPDANCSFPRNIRREGCEYEVVESCINFSENNRQKFFYIIKAKCVIKIIEDIDVSDLKIYGDPGDCVVCMEVEKNICFYPCGHFVCCSLCARRLDKCPMCRAAIKKNVNRSDII
jgi:hypothetical protein